MSGGRSVADWHQLVKDLLPTPVLAVDLEKREDLPIERILKGLGPRQAIIGGDPKEVIVLLGRMTLEIAAYRVVWRGPCTTELTPIRMAKVRWSELPTDRDSAIEVLCHLIEAARVVRQSKFQRCRRCAKVTPPEHMHDDEICQSCAVEHLGVVY